MVSTPPEIRSSGLRPMHSFVLALVVATAAVLAVAGCYVVVAGVPPLASGAQAQRVDAATLLAPPTPGVPRVVVVGDDFTTAGTWPQLVCEQVGCESVPQLSSTGSGWTVPGGDGLTIADRVDAVIAARPDVVILAAGAADTATDPERVSGTVNQVLYRISRRLPATRIVVLSPFTTTVPAPADLADVRSRIHDAAVKHGTGYVGVTAIDGGAQQQVADLVAPAVRAALGS